MEEKELKTSGKQRVAIAIIAILMLGSIIAGYAAIVINGNSSSSNPDTTSKVDEEKIAKYEEEYNKVTEKMEAASEKYYDKFAKYRSEVKAYNEASANSNGVTTKDYKEGDGRTIGENDANYLAYYIGWCADEKIFDSSFDNNDNPTKLKGFYDVYKFTPIEGWYTGVSGMKIGGVREMTIPSELAYKDQDVACGADKPLKFIIMTVEREGEMAEIADELFEATQRLQYAYYGMDYDEMMQSAGEAVTEETEEK